MIRGMSALLGLLALCSCYTTPSPEGVRNVLFFGNSHTFNNDVPAMVQSLLNGSIKTTFIGGGFLDDVWRNRESSRALNGTKWSHVVLQGAQLSSSHKYEYSNEGAIALAKLAIEKGAMPLFFVEWPRKGWDESKFQYDHYKALAAKAGGGELLPICWAWDAAVKGRPSLDLWAPDGNHAAHSGSYLAACVIAYWIGGTKRELTWKPHGLESGVSSYLRSVAKRATEQYRPVRAQQ